MGNSTELIDIYDANLKHLGVVDRTEAHLKGYWHKTFHCWVVNGKGEEAVLYQLRSPEVVRFPNKLDASAAGHIESGETVEQGTREVKEELGISPSLGSLYFLGYRVEVMDYLDGQMNREYQAVHFLHLDLPLSEYKPMVEEVTGLYWIGIRSGIELLSGMKDHISVHGIRYNEALLRWDTSTIQVSISDFLPRIQNYYLIIHIMAERLLEGKLPLSIS